MSRPKDHSCKIVNPFYTYHPAIIINGKKRKAFFGVEWTIWVQNKPYTPIKIHFMRTVNTEQEAQALTAELLEKTTEFGPWQILDHRAWYLSSKYKECILSINKVIIPKPNLAND